MAALLRLPTRASIILHNSQTVPDTAPSPREGGTVTPIRRLPSAEPAALGEASTPKPEGLKGRFLEMLGRDDPPELVAASFALGVAISFTPLIGLHWIIALFLAFTLRLNKVDILLGTLVVNPITLGPVSAVAIPIGRFLLQARREAVAHLPWQEFFKTSFWAQAGSKMRVIGMQWGVGMFVLAMIAGAVTYAVLLPLLRRRRERQGAAAALLG
jgi:uncharacterized protein (DUF2062 family)